MKIEVVNNINEYLNIIHKTENFSKNWFRGHKSANYRLEPTLYRNKKEIITGDDLIQFRHYEVKDEVLAIKEFKKNYNNISNKSNLSDIDYLYIMQHNGIETKLLDFTANPLIALFFSTVSSKKINIELEEYGSNLGYSNEYSAVFCINPHMVNHYSFDTNKIIDLSYVKFKKIQNLSLPICIEPSNNEIDKRIQSQNGKFILFGKEVNPLDWYSISKEYGLKILIPNSKRKRILLNLDKKFNINYNTIYPDMKGVRLQINKKIENKYKKL